LGETKSPGLLTTSGHETANPRRWLKTNPKSSPAFRGG
jgi:hypothetical protein